MQLKLKQYICLNICYLDGLTLLLKSEALWEKLTDLSVDYTFELSNISHIRNLFISWFHCDPHVLQTLGSGPIGR
jgi:hypothetical protein